jgi:hypothetical protein
MPQHTNCPNTRPPYAAARPPACCHCELTTGLAADPRLDERIFFNWRGPEQIFHFFLVS